MKSKKIFEFRKTSIMTKALTLMLVSGMVYLVSCKNDSAETVVGKRFNSGAVSVVVTQAQEADITAQLQWIARGIPEPAFHVSSFKTVVHDEVENNPDGYFETNTNLQTEMLISVPTDYESDVQISIDANFTPNTYDDDYFYEIDLEDCIHKVGIRIPEADIVDQTKLHVVTSDDPFIQDGTSTTGYYWDSINGHLDSLTIDYDNMDSVYLWVVGLVSNCRDGMGSGSAPEPDLVDEYCDNDGICEPEHGETPGNCPDCIPVASGQTLVLQSMTSRTDRKKFGSIHPDIRYQEAYLQNKYTVTCAFTLVDGVTGVVKGVREEHTTIISGVPTVYIPPELVFRAWGANSAMKRCKKKKNGNTKCNRGSHTIRTASDSISFDFDKDEDYIFITVYEEDLAQPSRNVTLTHNILNPSGTIIVPNLPVSHQIESNGKTYSHNTTPGFANDIVVIDPGDPRWILNGAGEQQITITLDGEMDIEFRIK